MKLLKLYRSLGIYGIIRLICSFIFSKILYPQARIIRLPFYIRCEGKIVLGKGFSSNSGLVIDVYGNNSKLVIGKNVIANYRLHIGVCEYVSIGENTLFGSDCLIMDHSHGCYKGQKSSNPNTAPNERDLFSKPIKIGKNCWFGDKVSILPGVTVGNGVVIGAGSVVTHDLPANIVAVGSPAKVIKSFDFVKQEWIPWKGI
ncbi:acetyltransferase [Alphaproteobacteria bacterium]|nr:acetyltransferase [Alphaproteobacteria bacterium]